jgi:hypothetical protein
VPSRQLRDHAHAESTESVATAGADVATVDRTKFSAKGPYPPPSLEEATAGKTASERAFGAEGPATAGDDTLPPGMHRIPDATLWAKDEEGNDLPPSLADIAQGSVADCFLIAALAAIVHSDPKRIQDMITDHGDGSFTVQLQGMGLSNAPASQTVKAEFVIGKHARTTSRKALWPLLVEKAYAEERGGIEVLDKGGNPGTAVKDLTNHSPRRFNPADRQADEVLGTLAAAVKEKHPITVLAPSKDGATDEQKEIMGKVSGLYLWHAYAVLEVDDKARRVKMFNPWGRDHPGGDGWIDLDVFQKFYIEVDINKP